MIVKYNLTVKNPSCHAEFSVPDIDLSWSTIAKELMLALYEILHLFIIALCIAIIITIN